MKDKKLGTIFLFTIFLFAGCGQSAFLNEETVNENQIQPEVLTENIIQDEAGEIEIIDGSPTEKVEIYNQKAIETQKKLELLLEQTSQSSFLDKIIPTVFAEESTEVEDLLIEIQTYLELAIESATESTNPAEIVELLEEVQTTQNETTDLLESFDSTEAVEDLVEEIAVSGDEVSTAMDEAASAFEAGLSEIQIDVETDVEDFLVNGATKIDLREKRDPIRRVNRKIQSAQNEYQKTKAKLIGDGVAEIEAEEMLSEFREKIATAEIKIGEGEFVKAGEIVTEGKRFSKQIKNASEVVSQARVYYENLKIEVDKGDELAAEKLEKLQPLVDSQKELKTIVRERVELRQKFIEDAKVIRQENQKVRREDRDEIRELKQKQVEGEISAEEFEIQKDEIAEDVKLKREEAKKVQDELREDHKNSIEEIHEKVQIQKEEVKNVQEQIWEDKNAIRENEKEDRSGNTIEVKNGVEVESCAWDGEEVFDLKSKGPTFCCEGLILKECKGVCTPSVLGICAGKVMETEVSLDKDLNKSENGKIKKPRLPRKSIR